MAGRDGVSAMNEFVERHGLGDLVHVADDSGDIWARFGISSQPAWVFVDDDGSVDTTFGILGEGGINDAMDALVAT